LNDHVRVVNSGNFDEEVLHAEQPVLVDFWAEWCPPCRRLAPTIDALAAEYAGRMKVAKLDVDESPDLAGRYGVRSIPTLLVFRGGSVVEQRIGALPKDDLARLLDGHADAPASAPDAQTAAVNQQTPAADAIVRG
jgi:thioredoxin 1